MSFFAGIRLGGAIAALAAIVVCGPSFAQQPAVPPGPDTVVARVNDAVITEGDLATAAQDFREQLAQVPAENRRERLIDLLVEISLAARAAESQGIDKDPSAARRLSTFRDRSLRLEYIRAKVIAPVTDEAVRKRFDEEIKKFAPADQVSARHILVQTEDEAKAVIAALDTGGDFDALAKEKSIDPGSKESGGDLGFFGPGTMVQPFEEAAMKLEVGAYTKAPVQSQFGWHIIKVDAKRKEPPPSFEEQSAAIRDMMIQELFVTTMDDLRVNAKIEIVGQAPAPSTTPATPPVTPPKP